MKFANEEKKRVYFLPEFQSELIKYFNENDDATLIVNFSEFILPKWPIDFDKISQINYKKILLTGSYHKTDELGVLLKSENLIELDNRDINLEYDFKYFPRLKVLRYMWQKKGLNISECKQLQFPRPKSSSLKAKRL